MVTVRSQRQWPQLEEKESELREIRAAVETEREAWVKEQESLEEEEIAWRKEHPEAPTSWFKIPPDLEEKEYQLVDATTFASSKYSKRLALLGKCTKTCLI
uniref:RxLR effector candidate protein n=1 Tax=Hyaloperonospora arabidopsidis (strain Emoy2) TaxID=559515 RepID=M4BQV1_HYAAE